MESSSVLVRNTRSLRFAGKLRTKKAPARRDLKHTLAPRHRTLQSEKLPESTHLRNNFRKFCY